MADVSDSECLLVEDSRCLLYTIMSWRSGKMVIVIEEIDFVPAVSIREGGKKLSDFSSVFSSSGQLVVEQGGLTLKTRGGSSIQLRAKRDSVVSSAKSSRNDLADVL